MRKVRSEAKRAKARLATATSQTRQERRLRLRLRTEKTGEERGGERSYGHKREERLKRDER